MTDRSHFRVALCLHGLADGKNSKGRKVHADIGAKCWQKQLLEKYNVDVFLHTWSTNSKKVILDWYHPKKYLFEEQINFISDIKVKDEMEKIRHAYCSSLASKYKNPEEDGKRKCYYCWKKMASSNFVKSDPDQITCANCYYTMKLYYRNLHSLYYSYYRANQLKSQYEKDNGFTYDLVITARFDLWVGEIIELEFLDPNKIHFLMFEKQKAQTPYKERNIIDHIFVSSSKLMNQFCDIYPNLLNYTDILIKKRAINQYLNHYVIHHHLSNLKLIDQLSELLDQFPAGALSTITPSGLSEFLSENCPFLTNDDLKDI